MKIRVYKKGDALLPFDDTAAKVLSKWKSGVLIEVEAKQPRNYEHHKKYFALICLVFKNTDHFENMSELQSYFKIKCGIYKTIKVKEIYYPLVGSINFSSMSQDEFCIFYDKSIQIALDLLGINQEELALQISQF